jgi:glycosyltransferase involved in cell wall biosynthesis
MRIGIFINESLCESGGAYSFERQVITEFLIQSKKVNHEFYIFSYQPVSFQTSNSYKHINFISLHQIFPIELIHKLSDGIIFFLRRMFKPGNYFHFANLKSSLEKKLLEKNIELIWSLGPKPLTLEIPYILTIWDLQHRLQPFFPEVSQAGEWDSREQIYSKSLRRAAFLITGTHTGKSEIERFYQVDAARIKILPLPTPKFLQTDFIIEKNILITKYKIPDKYLFYPAQFWPHKNHMTLLKAVQVLKNRYDISMPVVFVGSNKGNIEYIKSLARQLNILDQVNFLGFVPQEDLIALYRHAFALVFVSLFGPDNIPPLEAFALECPVIASRVPGSEEQLGDAAILVDPKDTEQIVSAVQLLHIDSDFRSLLIQKGLNRASQWTTVDYIHEVFKIFDEFEPIRSCWSIKNI